MLSLMIHVCLNVVIIVLLPNHMFTICDRERRNLRNPKHKLLTNLHILYDQHDIPCIQCRALFFEVKYNFNCFNIFWLFCFNVTAMYRR